MRYKILTVVLAVIGIIGSIGNSTIISVTNVKKSNGGDYDKSKSWIQFVVVTVLIKNTGTCDIIYNPFNFKMQNSKGEITDEAITSINSDTQLSSSSLASKKEITGTLVIKQVYSIQIKLNMMAGYFNWQLFYS